MRTFTRNVLILLCLILLGTPSGAQTGYGVPSLEALVGRADVVFSGTIVRLERTQSPQDEYPLFTVTIQVDTVLKGTPGKTVALKHHLADEDMRWKQWATNHTQILWLLGPDVGYRIGGHGPFTGWAIFRLGEAVPAERNYQTTGLPAPSLFLTVLRTPHEAIARIKAFLKANPKKVPHHSMAVSGDFIYQRVRMNGDWNAITVPIVPELETFAKRLIREPDVLFPPIEHLRIPSDNQSSATFLLSELDWLRLAGVRALVHFKSSENIALLKPLLADPTVWGQWKWSRDTQERKMERFYPVRQAAYEVLSGWGVQVRKPTIVVR